MSKKLIKQTAVAALLASTVLSFSPVAMGASSLDQSVNKVKSQLSKATTHYVNPSLSGKVAPSSALYPALNTMKKNYQSVRKSVVSSKLSSSQKQAKLNELDAVYNEKISGGLVPYIDAYNYATKYLMPIMKNIQVAQDRNDFATVEKEYHKLSYQLKGRTAILYRFSGKAARDLLLQEYKKPADAKRDELMVPVTIYMSLLEIKDFLADGKVIEAKAEFGEVEALLTRLPNAANNKFITALLEEVEKVKAAVNAETLTAQQVLDSKVEGLVTVLNTNFADSTTATTDGSNSLTVTVKEDLQLVEFLGKGFFSTFTSELGVTKVNGFDPTSAQGVNYLATTFSGADSLNDLKGKTVTLPLTVNNGSELTVNFTISFK
ncbi:hypothetical protein [Psychrobacillus sp. FSL H8-0510]|uniref:hypothetical protein n=1 Tax=Psychrobacillus sp. FSL H8-0510 TaxID=2921394 RepID=UPI0030F9B86D